MQNQQQDRVAWIGLGMLGAELTQHLQKYLASQSLPNLTVWNRSPEKSQKLQSLLPEVQVANSIEEIFTKFKANIIFTSLQNDAAVVQVYAVLTDLAAKATYPIIFVETGTLYPGLSLELEKQILDSSSQNHVYLQCPVFGRPEVARAAQMVWIASGNAAAIERLTPYLNSMSRQVMDLKTTDVSAGSTMKLVGNFMIASCSEMVSESVNVARKANLDPQHLISLVDTMMPAPIMKQYVREVVGGAEAPETVGMFVSVLLKDVSALKKWGGVKGAPMPTAELLSKNFETAKEKGFTNWNFMVDSINNNSAL
ncbi:NAD binding domain of 6-phosphogluconate dehydrogenase-domain-containing protein [Dissophora ornata]|nr:hypothetical protein BGZ58_000932 [Dissophora ornata]KAI8597694.1 NAD binding domain of 6-phosphogluconate dehydrogenase-domain-containing protein [Dissophora ornata]